MATPLWQAKTIMATPLWQVWNYCNSTLANQDRPNLSFLSHSILQTPFSSATPVRRTGQQTYRLVLQRIDYMFPLFLSVNKSLLKGQILIYLFYHHLATHLRISFSTPERNSHGQNQSTSTRRYMHPFCSCMGIPQMSISRLNLFSLFSLSLTLSFPRHLLLFFLDR
jgi:hypothetical protein